MKPISGKRQSPALPITRPSSVTMKSSPWSGGIAIIPASQSRVSAISAWGGRDQ